MRFVFAILMLFTAPLTAQGAELLSKDRVQTLACLEYIDISTTWSQCLALIFEPCAGEDVGGDGHVNCLRTLRADWESSANTLQTEVTKAITPEGNRDLTDILIGWSKYVGQKCGAAAEGREGDAATAAQLGCEVAEFTGLTSEFAACLEGRSNAEYCIYRKE